LKTKNEFMTAKVVPTNKDENDLGNGMDAMYQNYDLKSLELDK
jgi:hypothetical protein